MKQITNIKEYTKYLTESTIQLPGFNTFSFHLAKELDNKNSYLVAYLISLSMKKKEALIRALISANSDDLEKFFDLFLKQHVFFLRKYLFNFQDMKDIESVETKFDSAQQLFQRMFNVAYPYIKDYFKTHPNLKLSLIEAIAVEDGNRINDILVTLLTDVSSLSRHFAALPTITMNGHTSTLNAIVLKLIKTVLLKDKNGHPTPFDMNIILTNVFTNIPDIELSLWVKGHLYREISGNDTTSIRVGYVEPVVPLESKKSTREITSEEFLEILKVQNLDESELILLTLGYLRTQLKEHHHFLCCQDEILNDFMVGDYARCMEAIKKLITNFEVKIDTNIKALLATCKPEKPKLFENYSRRFFENRISSFMLGRIFTSPAFLNSINKFSDAILGSVDQVTRPHDVISLFSILSELDHEIILNCADELMDNSKLLGNKQRFKRPGFATKLDEANGKFGESIYSANLGIMRSMQPNYRDELSQFTLRNTATDINQPFKSDPQTIHPQNQRGVYIGSLSGHTFHISAMALLYGQANQDDPDLYDDIHHVLLAYFVSYVCSGYHSYIEVMLPFREFDLKSRFTQLGVPLDLNFTCDILEDALLDTVEYTKNCLLQKRMREELVERFKNNYQALGLFSKNISQQSIDINNSIASISYAV